jgi:hypothetical protein
MGLSIHYKGRINNYSLIDELTNEVEDICKILNWKYHIWVKESSANDNVHISNPCFLNYSPEDLKGITVSPEDCEPVALTFLPSGLLCSPVKLMCNDQGKNDLIIEVVSTKNQYAGPDTHIVVVNLLQYLKEKYFSDFELTDEGMYWETKDEKVLLSQFAKYNYALKTVTEALSDFKSVPGENVTSLAERLEAFLKKKSVRESR